MLRRLLGLAALASMTLAPRALACASCGSGGDSPLILYPNETYKFYLGLGTQRGIKTIDAAGKRVTSTGADRKDILTASGGFSFWTDFFATLTVPYVTNWHGDDNKRGLGDPLVSLHWTALPTDISRPYQPQVQVFVNHKQHTSRSVYDAKDPHWLDVFGTGFDETRLGLDVWHGTGTFKLGAAQTVQWPHERTIDGVDRSPGVGYRTTLTAGYGLDSMGSKVLVGVNRDAREKRRSAGKAVPDSEERNHSLFVTGDWMMRSTTYVRLTYSRLAAFGENKNTFGANSVTLAWMEGF